MFDRITTVTAAAASQDLAVLANVKNELGITDTVQDSVLAGYISSESEKIAAFCNRVFMRETLSEQFRSAYLDHTPSLSLSRTPVATLTSVTEDGELLTTADYELEAETGLLFRLSEDERIDWTASKIVVVYAGGYATLPTAVADACVQLVKVRYLNRGRDAALKSEEIDGVIRQDFWVGSVDDGLPPEVEMLLAPHRRYRC